MDRFLNRPQTILIKYFHVAQRVLGFVDAESEQVARLINVGELVKE